MCTFKLPEAGRKEHLELLEANKALAAQVDQLETRGSEIKREVSAAAAGGALSDAECRIMAKAVDDISNWLESIAVGPIIHAKKDDIEKKGKGLELLFAVRRLQQEDRDRGRKERAAFARRVCIVTCSTMYGHERGFVGTPTLRCAGAQREGNGVAAGQRREEM